MQIRRYLLALVVALSGCVALTLPHSTADAAPLPEPVRADLLPAPQIDGVVWKQVIVGNTVFSGGQFTSARPFGSPPGTNESPHQNLIAWDLTTGALDDSFAPTFNSGSQVYDMAATPDGSKLVVGGNFTQVNGQTRNRLAVFNVSDKSLNTAVVPSANAAVQALAATNSTIYAGGTFTTLAQNASAGTPVFARPRVGSFSASNGAIQPFTVHVDDQRVRGIVVGPPAAIPGAAKDSQVVLGGDFTSVGGSNNPGYGLYRANATTGAKLPLPVNTVFRDGGDNAGVYSLASDSTSFYGTGWHFGGPGGNAEGTFQASWSSGSLVTLEDCHGDTYDVAPIGNVVYTAGHKHYCLNSGGFPQTVPTWTIWHGTAWTKAAQGTNAKDTFGYADHPGTPRPALLPFFPKFQTGTATGQDQATWTVTGNSQYVLFAGEFPNVNGIAQQGIVRFGVRSVAPNASGPRTQNAGGALTLRARSYKAGEVELSLPAAWDRDDLSLTYHLYRDGTDDPAKDAWPTTSGAGAR